MDPYDLVKHDGKTVDRITHEALNEVEHILGYELTITQGSYRGVLGDPDSAGTHDLGGVVDLVSWDWRRKVPALRDVGFFAYLRTEDEGDWPEHIHAGLIGNRKLSPSAKRQEIAYRNGRNALKNNLPDPHPQWRPDPIPVFKMPTTPKPPITRIQIMRGHITRARQVGWEASQANTGQRRQQINDGLRKLREAEIEFPER